MESPLLKNSGDKQDFRGTLCLGSRVKPSQSHDSAPHFVCHLQKTCFRWVQATPLGRAINNRLGRATDRVAALTIVPSPIVRLKVKREKGYEREKHITTP